MAKALQFDGIEAAPYVESLYSPEVDATPVAGLEAWGEPQFEQYRELGFVSVAGVYTPAEVADAMAGLADLISGDVPEGVELQFENAAKGVVEALSPDARLDYVRKLMWFHRHDPRLLSLAWKPSLIAVVTRLLGAEPEVFQDMALLKPPGIGREKPWHQDHAYFNIPEGTKVVGVWIALDDADTDNGGMVVLPGSHREGPIPHFNRRDWQICDTEILNRKGQVATPIPSGGALIFDGLIPHGTPANRSHRRRRALQFHYIPKGTPRTNTEDRLRLFGPEGVGATC